MPIRFLTRWRRRPAVIAAEPPAEDDLLVSSGLFDAAFYLAQNSDLQAAGIDPSAHFRHFGAAEGRAPNAFLDPAWYRARNPDMADAPLGALGHYCRVGRLRGADPGPAFDSRFYLAANRDVVAAGLEPLAHFLRWGRAEGRRPQAPPPSGRPVDRPFVTRRPLPAPAGRRVALMVAEAADGRLPAHLPGYLAALRSAGLLVQLIVTGGEADPGNGLAAGLALAAPAADPFLLWTRALSEDPRLFDAAMLCLLTDRLPGPPARAALAGFFDELAASGADLVGVTAGLVPLWHCHDHFLALFPRLLRSALVQRGLRDILNGVHPPGDETRGATRLAGLAAAAGLVQRVAPGGLALFSPPQAAPLAPATAAPAVQAKAAPAAPALPAAVRSPPRIAYIGPWNYDNGAGIASRNYLSAWALTEFAVNRHPIERPFHTHRRIAPAVTLRDFDGSPDLAVVHLNPDGWPLYLTGAQLELIAAAPRRAGLWVWETGRLPDSWRDGRAAVDAVWTPSGYCRDLFGGTAFVVPHLVPLPPAPDREEAVALRQDLGLGPQERILLYIFDGASSLKRKNPFALVEAFAAAGLARRGWRLVLKTRQLFDAAGPGQRLAAMAAETPGVLLLDRAMAAGRLAALLALCDVYASPHRSEGFGLTIAEAMAAGRLVVATDHGGSRDFLDDGSGFPVACRLVEAGQDAIYGGGLWADIDKAGLVDALLAAACQAEAGSPARGRAARARIAERLSAAAVAAALRAAVAGSLAGGWR